MHTMSGLAAQPLIQPSDDIPAADGPPQYPALPPFEGRSDTMSPPTRGGAGALRPSVGEVSTYGRSTYSIAQFSIRVMDNFGYMILPA